MPDPLETVLRIRRVTVDDAKRNLAALLRAASAAQAKADAADALILAEGELAANTDGDHAVEAFAAWLPVGRAAATAARAAHEQVQSDMAKARAAVTVARAAAEAAESLLARRAAERAVAERRRTQAAMDEVAAQQKRIKDMARESVALPRTPS